MVKVSSMRPSFTLIELMISIGVLAVALSITAGVLLSVIKATQKQKVIAEVERNGSFVMSYIQESAIKALSINCQNSGASSTCIGGASDDELILGQGSTSLFIGSRGTTFNCASGTTVTNNFVYATVDSANHGDPEKLTNDSENGVHIASLAFVVSPGNPARLTVTMVVNSSNCGGWNVSKQFQSFITVRGTY